MSLLRFSGFDQNEKKLLANKEFDLGKKIVTTNTKLSKVFCWEVKLDGIVYVDERFGHFTFSGMVSCVVKKALP